MASGRSWLPRFSLRSFLIGIAVVSVGLAGVLSDSEGWSFALAAAFHLLLPTAVVLAIVLTGQSRAFWIGVVVFSVWCNVLLSAKTDFIADRLTNELKNRIDKHVSSTIVGLHESRIEREADEYLNAQLDTAYRTPLSPATRAAQFASSRPEFLQRTTQRVKNLATTSARRFLMILLSLGGGCLSAWAYRFRDPARNLPVGADSPGPGQIV